MINDETAAATAHLEIGRGGTEYRESNTDAVPNRTARPGRGKHVAKS
jgi:hypothetical protein